MSADAPISPPTSHLLSLQQAFLLGQLATEGNPFVAQAKLNKKIPAAAKRELQLTNTIAEKIRRELVEQQFVKEDKQGRTVAFAITDSGRAYLDGLEKPVFTTRTAKKVALFDETGMKDELRKAQRTAVLLQLFDADKHTLGLGEANKLLQKYPVGLGLKPAVADFRHPQLAEQKFIQINKNGRTQEYTLLPDGVDELVVSVQHIDHFVVPVRGRTLNALIAAAHDAPFEKTKPTAERRMPDSADLAEAVLAEFQDLRNRRHGQTGLVPIHEVRQKIAAQFGPAAARHEVLDEVILGLWRERRIGLESISDRSSATEQQLGDGIPDEHSTLFYLEVPREQPISV